MKKKLLVLIFLGLLALASFSFTSTANYMECVDDSCCPCFPGCWEIK